MRIIYLRDNKSIGSVKHYLIFNGIRIRIEPIANTDMDATIFNIDDKEELLAIESEIHKEIT